MEFFAPFYKYIYLFICSLVFLLAIKNPIPIMPNNFESVKNRQITNIILLLIFLVVFIGTRPVSMEFCDMTAYNEVYQYAFNSFYIFDPNAENVVWDNMLQFFASLGIPITFFFVFDAFLYFGFIALSCKKVFPKNAFIAFCVCLVAFSTFSYGTNGVKAGLGASTFLLALAYKEKLWISIPLALLSLGFHHSMKVVIYAYILCFFYKNTKMYFYIWVFSFLIAALHIGFFQQLFASYADESGASYLSGKQFEAFTPGFRLDFILYSAAPVYLAYKQYFKENFRNEKYELWLRMYLLMNSIWMLCMYANFTNRIAYLSWFMYPVVLMIPYYSIYYKRDQQVIGKKIAMYHLYFTLFMEFVYYGILR